MKEQPSGRAGLATEGSPLNHGPTASSGVAQPNAAKLFSRHLGRRPSTHHRCRRAAIGASERSRRRAQGAQGDQTMKDDAAASRGERFDQTRYTKIFRSDSDELRMPRFRLPKRLPRRSRAGAGRASGRHHAQMRGFVDRCLWACVTRATRLIRALAGCDDVAMYHNRHPRTPDVSGGGLCNGTAISPTTSINNPRICAWWRPEARRLQRGDLSASVSATESWQSGAHSESDAEIWCSAS